MNEQNQILALTFQSSPRLPFIAISWHRSLVLAIMIMWAAMQENLSSRFPTRSYPNQPAQLQRLARISKISLVASFDIILSNKGITKTQTRLHVCAGWSAPLLLTNLQRQAFLRQGPCNIRHIRNLHINSLMLTNN